jgi:hypothetical protein
MKSLILNTALFTTILATSLNPAMAAKGGRNASPLATTTTTTSLDEAERTHLVFMREEEKLARDTYLTLASMYPNTTVFANIGEKSEQTHTDTMRDKLAQYNVEDPNPDTNNLPYSMGVFTGEEYGEYFTQKFDALIARGSASELEALYAGAFIEELDMYDIIECPTIIQKTDNGVTECGLIYTDETALINAYTSLVDGSKSHLRAYVGNIEAIIGVGNYEAQYLSQAEVDSILGR